MRVIVDTNVVVSRFLAPRGAPAVVLTLWEQGAFDLVVSEPILAEYQRVLAYPRLRARHGRRMTRLPRSSRPFATSHCW